jgi:hypothetical protein
VLVAATQAAAAVRWLLLLSLTDVAGMAAVAGCAARPVDAATSIQAAHRAAAAATTTNAAAGECQLASQRVCGATLLCRLLLQPLAALHEGSNLGWWGGVRQFEQLVGWLVEAMFGECLTLSPEP